MANISGSLIHVGKTQQIAQQIIQNYGVEKEELDKLRNDLSKQICSELHIEISQEVKTIVGEIVGNALTAILLHMDEEANSEEEFRRSLLQNFEDIKKNEQSFIKILIAEINKNWDNDKKEIENLERLSRDTARQANEAFGKIINILSGIKDIAQEFKKNIRLDYTYELTQGWSNIREGRFDTAEYFFKRAQNQVLNEAEAYFGLYLVNCKIQVLWDCVNCRWQPICHDIAAIEERLDNNSYYNSALHHATDSQREEFEEFNDEIKDITQEFENIKNRQYDCFICVKVKDNDKKFTDDSHDAMFLYGMLKDAGYHPFYSEMNVRYMEGKEYEAHILYALYKAKCMIVVCSNKEYLKTPWVKNEYTRYIDMMKSGDKHRDSIRIAYRGKTIERLPGINSGLESIDLSEMDSGYRIEKFVKQFVGSDDERTTREEANATKAKAEEDRQVREEAERKAREAHEEAERKVREANEKIKEFEKKLEEALKVQKNETNAEVIEEKKQRLRPKKEANITKNMSDEVKPSNEKSEAQALSTEHPILFYDATEFEIDGYVLKKYKGKKENVKIPNGVKSIGEYAFEECTGLTSITIPNSVTSIGWRAFYLCSGLTSITIPNSVKDIGNGAFYGCTGLTSINIPNNVTSIGTNPFMQCDTLGSITVDTGNPQYISEGNCLIDKKAGELIAGCKSSIIPFGVTSIGVFAFYGCKGLISITIPNSVTSMGVCAFYGCTGLTSITIPTSVTSILSRAFDGCSLQTVYYEGTWETWRDILIEYYNDCLTNANCYYYSERPNYDGQHWHRDERTHTPKLWKVPDKRTGTLGIEVHKYAAREKDRKTSDEKSKAGESFAKLKCPNCKTPIEMPPYVKIVVCPDCGKKYKNPNYVAPTPQAEAERAAREEAEITNNMTDEVKAIFKKAKTGDAAAQGSLGYYYTKGQGVEQDYNKAVEWYRKAAEQGYAQAQYNLGVCYEKGQGVEKNLNKAIHWYTKAAEQGLVQAREKLAKAKAESRENDRKSSGELSKTEALPADYPTLKNYDRNGFKINNDAILTKYLYNEQQVRIPYGIKDIGEMAFSNCTRLTSITIPNSVTSIGDYAFKGCTNLTSITIPNSVMSIGECAFEGCTRLTSITIPNSVISIKVNPFKDCDALENIMVDLGNENYESDGNCLIYKKTGLLIAGCKSSVIPNSVTIIGKYAFYYSKLTFMIIPNSVEKISGNSFHCHLQQLFYEGTISEWNKITIAQSDDIWTAIIGFKNIYYFSSYPIYDRKHWHWDEGTHTPKVWKRFNK